MNLNNSCTLEQFIIKEVVTNKIIPNFKTTYENKTYMYGGNTFSYNEIKSMARGLRIINISNSNKTVLLIDNELYKVYEYIISRTEFKDKVIIFKLNDKLYYELDLPIEYSRCNVIDIYTRNNRIIIEFDGDGYERLLFNR